MEKTEEELIRELEEKEIRFASMLMTAELLSMILGANEKVLFVSNYLLRMTGRQRDQVIGQNWFDIFVSEETREKRRNIFQMITEGLVEFASSFEEEIVSSSGRKFTVAWNSTASYHMKKIVCVTCVGQEKAGILRTNSYPNILMEESASVAERAPSLQNVPVMVGDYIVLSTLGEEKSKVKLAVHKDTKEEVAVKVLNKSAMTEPDNERARREIDIMRQLTTFGNPHIVRLIDAQETDSQFVLVEEYVRGGELVKFMEKNRGLPEDEARRLFKQILSGLECCHRNNIIHRDLKLENILLDDEQNIKLIDFGVSNFVEVGVYRNTFCGTPAYCPPEILLGKKYAGPEVDLWSLGVVLYYLLTSTFPFPAIGDIIKGKFAEPANVSQDSIDLVKRALTVKKEDRITLDGVLSHSWLNDNFAQDGPEMKKRKFSDVDSPVVQEKQN